MSVDVYFYYTSASELENIKSSLKLVSSKDGIVLHRDSPALGKKELKQLCKGTEHFDHYVQLHLPAGTKVEEADKALLYKEGDIVLRPEGVEEEKDVRWCYGIVPDEGYTGPQLRK